MGTLYYYFENGGAPAISQHIKIIILLGESY